MIALSLDLSRLELQRRQLGMSRVALARRSGVPLPTVQRILSGKQSRASVANLHAIANTLGLSIRLGVGSAVHVEQTAHDMRKSQALAKARRLVGMGQATMALESQAVAPDVLEQMTERTVNELLAGSSHRLWDE
jgi:transcriptional regulator with XRE-family HTH domain